MSASISLPAISIELLERCLDRVALEIDRSGEAGLVYMPIYERLEKELDDLRTRGDALSRVRDRLRRSPGRTEARSS